jgi:hypothetical protein
MARKYAIDRVTWMDVRRPNTVWFRWADEVRASEGPQEGEEMVAIHTALESPAVLRELADLIEAGPPIDVMQVEAIVQALVASGRFDLATEREVRTIAESLWRSGVRPQ